MPDNYCERRYTSAFADTCASFQVRTRAQMMLIAGGTAGARCERASRTICRLTIANVSVAKYAVAKYRRGAIFEHTSESHRVTHSCAIADWSRGRARPRGSLVRVPSIFKFNIQVQRSPYPYWTYRRTFRRDATPDYFIVIFSCNCTQREIL